ncbi:regulator of G-protein signaling 22 [Limanda limanda]|uniref:regulator of G-protein signaling 22 n=1 Tax=Limanda limanda TaxID=27771 RepID=UPI0029C71B79|nr:regulator of G-protein signaling 22 [Limanda limanda]
MCGLVSAELPHLTADNFVQTLATDDVLAHFFNDFLSLPSFPEAVLYNQETRLFELVSDAAEFISRRIITVLNHSKSQLLTGDPSVLTRTTPLDNHFTVSCLDRKQGIQWIMEERLPLFLQSDCYIEYRLAKLLCQWDPNICIQSRRSSSGRILLSAPPRCSASRFDKENNNAPKPLICSRSLTNISSIQGSMTKYNLTYLPSDQKEHINTKCKESSRCFSRCSEPENPCSFPALFSSCSSSSNLKCNKTQEPQSTQIELYLSPEMQYLKESRGQSFESVEAQMEDLAAKIVKQVLNNALRVMTDESQGKISDCFNKSAEQTNCTSKEEKLCECVCQHSANGGREPLEGIQAKVPEDKTVNTVEEKTEWDKRNREVGSWDKDRGNVCDIGCHVNCCLDNRPGLDEFREFLRGTPGEKLIHFWMDIEKLNSVQPERKNRHLVLMRGRYLLSSSHSSLNTELLSTLGLTTSTCWTEEKLCSVQPCLIDALLYYWAPRFWKSQFAQEDHDDSSNKRLWTEWGSRPLSGRQPHCDLLTLPLLVPDSSLSQPPITVYSQSYCSRSQLLVSRRMETMLQALYVDSRAGLFFTHFCVQSGNQLWENAVYFWTDLQHYQELFYQEGLDPYRVQKEAQLLYSTYLSASARRSIGVDEEVRRKVYDRLIPAFEELFDEVEENTLNILLQPWTLLLSRDKESFQKVHVQEEVHRVDSEEYRELHSVYEESERRLKEVQQSRSMLSLSPTVSSTSFPKGPRALHSWSRVSPKYQGYCLGSLLRQNHEIGHFLSFLQNQDASIHLTCWLDLEQYRRTPQKDNAVKQGRSSHIATKYLSRKYFFGPESPASTEQQNDILYLAGGQEHLKLECLSNRVVAEIQGIIRNHIEKKWLPQFLSTAEFTERQRHKPQASSSWMSSSKEILLFRQILLNPVTCTQFQHFVSLKGDFLENDMLFWLEVQRYKDLCHSHSDDATIQQKISTIINCFINSSIPPTLQIDIPPEQAQHILEKRRELGPYIFREAQMSVFSELLKFWPEFQELCSSVEEEHLLPLLQDKQVKHRARVRRQRRKVEEDEEEDERRRAQEEWATQESSFEEAEDMDSDPADTEEPERRSSRSGRREWRTQSRALSSASQPLSWSYSKYMAALKREEVMLRRKSQLEASFATASDSSCCSVRSADSQLSHRRSHPSSRAESTKCNRYNSK